MNMLALLQAVAERLAIPVPTGVQSSSDPQIMQLRGLLNELMEHMQTRKGWQVVTREATFTSTATESQGNLATLSTDGGFKRMIADTLYDRTQSLPIPGALTSQEWQAIKAGGLPGPYYRFRLRGGELLIAPTMPAGHTIAFEYESNYFVTTEDGLTRKPYFTLDTDICIFPDSVVLSWLKWRWKAEKGFDYGEDFRSFESLVAQATGDQDQPRVVQLDCEAPSVKPGIVVPLWITP